MGYLTVTTTTAKKEDITVDAFIDWLTKNKNKLKADGGFSSVDHSEMIGFAPRVVKEVLTNNYTHNDMCVGMFNAACNYFKDFIQEVHGGEELVGSTEVGSCDTAHVIIFSE